MSVSPSSTRRTRSSSTRAMSPTSGTAATATRSSTDRHVTVQRRSSPSNEASASTHSSPTGEAVQSILKARKCWRSIKGKEEAVWPPELEAALIEGLEKYRPAESKSTRVLGRFPMRNKFVADHIFDVTGIRRTPKQVGSRIQQLRDTNSGKHILKAISDRHYEMMRPKKRESPERVMMPRATSSSAPAMPRPPSPSTSHVYIQTLPPHVAWQTYSSRACEAPSSDLHAQEPRPMRMIDPTVTFTSPVQSACQSSFRVFKNGMIIHEEAAPVSISAVTRPHLAGTPAMYLYTTSLVPQYWAQLCAAEDPGQYAIHQEVIRSSSSSLQGHGVLLSVWYHFMDSYSMSPPLSPHSSCSSEVDLMSFPAESSPLLEPSIHGASPYDFVLRNRVETLSVPSLIEPFEDGYSSQPGSPEVDMPLVGITQWGYPAQTLLTPELEVPTPACCDSYFDPAPFSPHVFSPVFQ